MKTVSKPGLLLWTATWIACLFVTGCGEKLPPDLPKLHPASVRITLDGVPLKKAIVTLTPDHSTPGQSNLPVTGVTDDQGVAVLKTNGRYNGSPAGKYKVCVSKSAAIEGRTSKTPPPADPKELARYNKKVEDERNFVNAIAEEYSAPGKTVLELEIVDGKNSFSFDVKKAPGTPDFSD